VQRAQDEDAAKVAEMMALLQKQMELYGDTHPLKVANPQPAEWTPPGPGDKKAAKAEKKANKKNQ
jgi:hypothetical protein